MKVQIKRLICINTLISLRFSRIMLSTVKISYPHPDGNIGIVPWLAELPSLLQKGLYADVVLHPMKEDNNPSGIYINHLGNNIYHKSNTYFNIFNY